MYIFGSVLCGLYGMLFCSCAYYSTSSGLVGGISSIAIPVAENDTAEDAIAERLTERTTDAFVADGRLRVVDEESSDAILILRLRTIDDKPFTFTAQEITEQYRFLLWIEVDLLRGNDEMSLLRLNNLEGWGTYAAALPDEEGRDLAIENALDMVIEEIVDRTTSSW